MPIGNGFPVWSTYEKKRCPRCGRSSVKRNGFHPSGRQRYFCSECRTSFLYTRPDNKLRNERIWFERWLKEGYNVRQLSDQSGLNRSKLYRIINSWLERKPTAATASLEKHEYLIFDGSFFHNTRPIVVLMDARQHMLIHGAYGLNERNQADLLTFFLPLQERGLQPRSCTIDGNRQSARVLKQIWPEIVLQRCLVHVRRQGLSWCRLRPKRQDSKELRDLFAVLTEITTPKLRDQFLSELAAWEERFGSDIAPRPERGKVFSDLKKARSMLLKAVPDLFHYLDDPNIPRSTNGLEGYFSRMKRLYRCHSGLTRTKSYCEWYFQLVRK